VAENHAPTTQTVNAKKKAHDAEQMIGILEREAPQRKARLQELDKNREHWAVEERKEYERLAAQDKIDPQKLRDRENAALGVVVVEFLAGAIAEIRDLYRRGMEKDSFIAEARVRLQRVRSRVEAVWRDALAGLRDGFVAGLLASLATTLINAFVTTGTRVVRMIREGFMSLLRAVKLLVARSGRQFCLQRDGKFVCNT
jgi:hypothetical protein